MLNNNLKAIRKSKQMTQNALSIKANVSRPYISDIENGKQREIGSSIMINIANALDEKVENIFFKTFVNHNEQSNRY